MATNKQIEEWKTKAEKWDALDKAISRYYFKDGQEDVIDDPEQ